MGGGQLAACSCTRRSAGLQGRRAGSREKLPGGARGGHHIVADYNDQPPIGELGELCVAVTTEFEKYLRTVWVPGRAHHRRADAHGYRLRRTDRQKNFFTDCSPASKGAAGAASPDRINGDIDAH